MKKTTLLMLIFVLVLSLCACGRREKETAPTSIPTTVPVTTSNTTPATEPTMDTIIPMPSGDMDSGLLDTSEDTKDITDTTMTPVG